ncbi:disulfide bond formation protein DsbA [Nocardia yamanashiensis]|uniref:mycothiol-dependent nitroreductase Rv2466c family protein n=1 Tax=Nocardia yamanashiensis TaxID=209247 RepID=UPI001E51DDBD|nr:disulfide bond formation protein DsbA [Nocardia yamanashiensis]UGT42079.1 disulfide bond formation protein DsbA [Nocardia yamanashiensis]
MSAPTKCAVELFVDPACPYTWIAYRWLGEVARQRPLELRLRLMSLARLNRGRELPRDQHRQIRRATDVTRIAAAVDQLYGAESLRDFYSATAGFLFTPEHTDVVLRGRADPRPWSELLDKAIAAGLFEAGLPAALTAASRTDRYDPGLHASHDAAIAAVGTDVGTPVLCIDGHACFGPVLASVPRGAAAQALFDSVRTLSAYPDFFELKRTRRPVLDFH